MTSSSDLPQYQAHVCCTDINAGITYKIYFLKKSLNLSSCLKPPNLSWFGNKTQSNRVYHTLKLEQDRLVAANWLVKLEVVGIRSHVNRKQWWLCTLPYAYAHKVNWLICWLS